MCTSNGPLGRRRRRRLTQQHCTRTCGQLGVETCLATIRRKSVPANIVAPVQLVTPQNVARAQANFPRPVEPFDDVLAELLNP